MRRLAVVLLLAGTALPAFGVKRVTVEQLQQVVAASHGRADAETARELSDLELTERLSTARLSRWRAGLPGDKSQKALLALADAAAFLAPPASEIPATAAPDLAAQRQMMGLAVEYVRKSVPQLPNVFATRITTRFLDKPQGRAQEGEPTSTRRQPLHAESISRATVVYRDGRESAVAEALKSKEPPAVEHGLATWGTFGPVLVTVLLDAGQSKLAWSHWEQGAAGPEAVFRYEVPTEKSHYDLHYCCFTSAYGFEINEFQKLTAYHGEIAIDPDNGSILRLTLEADLKPEDPLTRAAMMVEYAPVEIGGQSYICPARSVAVSVAPAAQMAHNLPSDSSVLGGGGKLTASASSQGPALSVALGPRQTFLNDIAFEQYHAFRAESRVMSEESSGSASSGGVESASASSPSVSPEPIPAGSGSPNPAAEAVSSAAGSQTTGPAAALPPQAAAAEAPTPKPEPAASEITVTEATGIPDRPIHPTSAAAETGFTLRTTARLVDVGLVAFDKKGHPVTNLKAEDLEIYDNGRKQAVRFFSQAGEESAAAAANQPSASPVEAAFSNRHTSAADGSATILLLDASNLAFGDLTYARAEALRFLKALPAGERVGFYVMNSRGFKILAEETTDHAPIMAKLAQWMPSAQDLSNAQDEERRNRQQIETVVNPEDLLNVNGNINNDPQSQAEPLDAKLRDFGANPSRDALTTLVVVARHLAALPGHKSLVWIASDNVLADWSNKSVTIEKTSKYIEGFALHAQEAMNDAHVSVYPLDASQLESGVIDASIGRRNVELTETFEAPPAVEQHREGPEMTAGRDVDALDQQRDPRPGRLSAQMQQDLHPIQGPIREVADATGGRVFRRSSSIAAELDGVVNDGRAAYALSFTPDQPADDKYHVLTVKTPNRRDLVLRYRTGYEYDKEPETIKDRFRQAVWQPADVNEIAVTARMVPAGDRSKVSTLKLNIAATDLDLAQRGELWNGKLDIFFVERDDIGLHAQVAGQTMGLLLKPATYQKLMHDGIPLERQVELKPETGSVRVLVVDEYSGRMGSVTVPTSAIGEKR